MSPPQPAFRSPEAAKAITELHLSLHPGCLQVLNSFGDDAALFHHISGSFIWEQQHCRAF